MSRPHARAPGRPQRVRQLARLAPAGLDAVRRSRRLTRDPSGATCRRPHPLGYASSHGRSVPRSGCGITHFRMAAASAAHTPASPAGPGPLLAPVWRTSARAASAWSLTAAVPKGGVQNLHDFDAGPFSLDIRNSRVAGRVSPRSRPAQHNLPHGRQGTDDSPHDSDARVIARRVPSPSCASIVLRRLTEQAHHSEVHLAIPSEETRHLWAITTYLTLPRTTV